MVNCVITSAAFLPWATFIHSVSPLGNLGYLYSQRFFLGQPWIPFFTAFIPENTRWIFITAFPPWATGYLSLQTFLLGKPWVPFFTAFFHLGNLYSQCLFLGQPRLPIITAFFPWETLATFHYRVSSLGNLGYLLLQRFSLGNLD